MEKKLSSLLDSFECKAVAADGTSPLDLSLIGATPIAGLAFDSREVKENYLFFALPGTHVNGNEFIAPAIDAGASVVIFQGELTREESVQIAKSVVCRTLGNMGNANKKLSDLVMPVLLKVDDARKTMAPVSSEFYSEPSKKLIVIGVTGTEGKSSTVSFIWQLLRLSGKKAGFISTVQYSLGGDAVANPVHATTPEAPIIQRELYEMVQNGCEYAVVESSSHGLSKKLGRLDKVLFDCGVFMNVTLEHLEFHKTFEQYRDDKANLFRALDEHSHHKIVNNVDLDLAPCAVVNMNDPSAEYFAKATKAACYGFAAKECEPIDGVEYLSAKKIDAAEKFLEFEIEHGSAFDQSHENITTKTICVGAFNAMNIMAAMIAVNKMAGIPLRELARRAASLIPVTGRMTKIERGQDFEVIVDYAHTPSSFEEIFPPIKERCKGRLFALFGSGGERDLTKRPLQGKIAAKYCDVVILCDEDPRGEDPRALLEQIAAGAKEEGMSEGAGLFIVPDRPTAIRRAFSMARKNDIVLLLGKGHENSIIYKDRVMPYDEIAEAKKALAESGYNKEV
ncbi:MAG: UDP-N-acetylmuramoyl-L-alanyl-D-glutamate--2,6-diaminopimelate ligase [Treponema sp.]|nr:UDP-N-acetylmuramoyl-L-alanyl-D-glutamate--2,6-diaminopimelate ligase [Treponema sp.]